MRVRYFGHSDVGLHRANNEDAFMGDPDLGLFIVADGVGGRAKGEVASNMTCQYIWDWIKREEALLREPVGRNSPARIGELCTLVRQAVQNACYMVHNMGLLNPDQKGMSTTASALLVTGNVGIVGQVGDSRVYLVRDNRASQLTEDHTLVNYQLKHGLITPEQAEQSNVKNVITRAVGHRDYVEVDTIPLPLFPHDRVLLCSDGLHGYLEDVEDMENLLCREVQESVLACVRYANERGGKDNITALLVEMRE